MSMILCVLPAYLAVAAAAPPPVPVILDTDIGDDIDDTWALMMLLGNPQIDLKLVVTAFHDTHRKTRLLAKMLEKVGRTDVSIGTGVKTKDAPINQEEWLGDYSLDDYKGTVCEDGVQRMIEMINASPVPITLIVIGPQTNIREALKRDPDIAKKARVVSMAGSVEIGYGGKEGRFPEWNVRADVEAARAVFDAPWDITYAPLDSCGTMILKGDRYKTVAESKNPLAVTTIENYQLWKNRKHHPADTSSVLFDTVAIYLAFDESFCKMETVKLSIDDKGNTVPDPDNGRPVHCAMDWNNRDAFEDLLVKSLTSSNSCKVSRGYSIPTIDLNGDTERQVVIDKEPGQYLGHPTTVLLEDNKTMICVYPKGHGRGAIVMKRSTDAGLTWSDRLPVPENWATSLEVPTIYRVVDPKGVKRLIMFSGLYPNRMAVSEDDGQNWTPLEPIGDFGGIVSMSSCIRLKDGRYMALFHDDGRFLTAQDKGVQPLASQKTETPLFNVYKTLSADGGLTWSAPEIVTHHPQAHLCEPGAIRSPDGNQIVLLLRENSRQFNSMCVFSDDEGETWSNPIELPGSLTGDRHVGRYAPDGRLMVAFRDTTHESPTKGDFVAWVGTYEDIVAGREGQYRVRFLDNTKGADCAYPALDLLPDGTFIATTYGHWIKGEQPFIMSVRFTMDDLDKKAAAL